MNKEFGKIRIFKAKKLTENHERQKTRNNVHHLAGIGAGKKASDLLTFPLCEMHHDHPAGKAGITIHKGIAEFEKEFKPQFEFIGIINERILRDNNLSAKDFYHCQLVSGWVEAQRKEIEKRL
jgi:hypothetical protein